MLRVGSANGNNDSLREWKYWNEFVRFVEKQYKDINLKVDENEFVQEAWIPCHVTLEESVYRAVLTWVNCD